MKFELKKLGITVDLDDELYNEYSKYDDVRENNFGICIRCTYGDNYKNISNEELSKLCNDVLLSDLKCLALLPKAIYKMGQYTNEHSDNDELVDIEYNIFRV